MVVCATTADAADRSEMDLTSGSIVLVVRAVDVELGGTPLQYSVSRFAADKVELVMQSGLDGAN